MNRVWIRATMITTAIVAGVTLAGVADLLTVFRAGEPIRADEMNENFAAIAERVDVIDARFGGTRSVADGRVRDCVLGDVWLSALTSFVPGVAADGRLLPIADNSALFSLLGTTYGGDGRTTFALPDLRDAAPRSASGESMTYVICTVGVYPSRL